MNSKLTIQFFAGILLLVSGIVALIKGIVEPSERSAVVGIAMLVAAAYLLVNENPEHPNHRRELKPVRVRARN